jgi:hypothetical protein
VLYPSATEFGVAGYRLVTAGVVRASAFDHDADDKRRVSLALAY